METRQITPFFSTNCSAVSVTFIFAFENNKNLFSGGPPFGPFWPVKYPPHFSRK